MLQGSPAVLGTFQVIFLFLGQEVLVQNPNLENLLAALSRMSSGLLILPVLHFSKRHLLAIWNVSSWIKVKPLSFPSGCLNSPFDSYTHLPHPIMDVASWGKEKAELFCSSRLSICASHSSVPKLILQWRLKKQLTSLCDSCAQTLFFVFPYLKKWLYTSLVSALIFCIYWTNLLYVEAHPVMFLRSPGPRQPVK